MTRFSTGVTVSTTGVKVLVDVRLASVDNVFVFDWATVTVGDVREVTAATGVLVF